jgi:hypothetical protein
MRARKTRTWQAVVAALVVAIGIGVAWGLLGGWLVALAQLNNSSTVAEGISIAADGTPIIGTDAQESYQRITVSRRTLDDKPWPLDYEFWLGGSQLAPYAFPGGLLRMPLAWEWAGRVGGYTDGSNPPASWYVVRDDEPESRCYFAGFDSMTRLPIGYIGRGGLRATVPERDEQFALPGVYSRQLAPFLASTQYFQMWGLVNANRMSIQQREPAEWLIFVAEGNKVWEVDLRKRSARIFAEIPGIVSIALTDTLEKTVAPEITTDASKGAANSETRAKEPAPQSTANVASEKDRKKAPDMVNILAVRTNEKLVLLTPSGQRREFNWPREVPNVGAGVYWIAPHEVLYQFQDGHWSGGRIERLVWENDSGKVTKDVPLKLAGYPEESPHATAWAFGALVPVPILYSVGALIGAPLNMVQNYAAPTFAAGVAKSFSVVWIPLACVLALAAVLTWLTIRLQRKYRRPWTGVWATFVFLLGLPGFLAYLVECRRTKLEACPQCGAVVPRDRETCAACEKEFRAPAPVGTEIFA